MRIFASEPRRLARRGDRRDLSDLRYVDAEARGPRLWRGEVDRQVTGDQEIPGGINPERAAHIALRVRQRQCEDRVGGEPRDLPAAVVLRRLPSIDLLGT